MFRLFKKKNATTNKSPEEQFWNWFLKNKSQIEGFIDSKHSDYSIYNKLSSEIKKYHPVLFAELTKDKDDNYVLIITPDGIKKGIEPTQNLAKNCPIINNWKIKKFRQPNDEIRLNYNGLEYPSEDIILLPEIDHKKEKVNIEVFIKNMNNDVKRYQHLAFLYFDHILGEFNTITKVGYIDFFHIDPGKTVKNGISLLELRKLIEQELY